MKEKKKSIRVLKYVFLAALFICINVNFNQGIIKAATNTTSDGKFEYCISNGTVCIEKYLGNEVDVVVPETIDEKNVTEIGNSAFGSCDMIESVQLPSSLEIIQSNAFKNCTNLKNINIPKGVWDVYKNSFENTQWLKNKEKENPFVVINGILIDGSMCTGSVSIPEGVTRIGDSAFYKNDNITNLTVPDSVIAIEDNAFYDCYYLKTVDLSNGVERIGSAFDMCYQLKDIQLSDKINYLDSSAFSQTQWLDDQRRKNELVVINNILYDARICSGEVKVPEGVTKIGNKAFEENYDVTKVILPKSVKCIESYAFYHCKNLQSISIPESVKEIEKGAFDSCKKLESILLPSSISSIKEYTFYDCINLKNVEIPNTVTTIEEGAFINCIALESLIIPSSVKSIGGDVFLYCNSLKTISFLGNQQQLDNILKNVIASDQLIDSDPLITKIKSLNAFIDSNGLMWSNDVKYGWTPDNNACTATMNCISDPTKNRQEKVHSICVVIKSPTTSSKGQMKYTATFSNKAFATQTKLVPMGKLAVTTPPSQKTKMSNVIKALSKVKINQIKNIRKKKIKLAIKKIKGVKGYEVSYSLNKKFKKASKKLGKAKTTTYTLSKLKKGKTYYVRVRAYKMIGKKKVYGKWSSVRKVKIKK